MTDFGSCSQVSKRDLSLPGLAAHAGAAVAIVLLAGIPETAFAYLDPGYGSMLLQGAIALVGSVLATVGLYWKSVKTFIRSRFKGKSPAKAEVDQQER